MSSGRREGDDDLMLFKELLRRKEQRNVSLLQLVSDDFDASPGIHGFYRLSSGKRGGGCDLFALDGEKTDFDWLKTPPPTPLFPSLEMESVDSKFLNYKDPSYIKLVRSSRFAKIQGDQKPIQRPKSPSARSTTTSSSSSHSTSSSSRSATPNRRLGSSGSPAAAATITLGDALNIKRRPKKTRSTTSKPSSTTTIAAASDANPRTQGVTGEAQAPEIPTTEAMMPRRPSLSPGATRWRRSTDLPETPATAASAGGNLVLGSRMVEKMMNARRSAAPAPAPASELSGNGRLMTRSSLDLAFKHMELRKGISDQQQKNSVSNDSIPEATSGSGARQGRILDSKPRGAKLNLGLGGRRCRREVAETPEREASVWGE